MVPARPSQDTDGGLAQDPLWAAGTLRWRVWSGGTWNTNAPTNDTIREANMCPVSPVGDQPRQIASTKGGLGEGKNLGQESKNLERSQNTGLDHRSKISDYLGSRDFPGD